MIRAFTHPKKFVLFVYGLIVFTCGGCGVYTFNEGGQVPADVKSIKITLFENVAPYVNPQLTPVLTDRLRQKINNQTRLTITNSDAANWLVSGQVTDYTTGTVAATVVNGRSVPSLNRLTVSVRVTLTRQIENKEPEEFTASRQFDFPASQSIQQAESRLLDEIVKNLSDEIYNHIFSNW